MDHPENRIRGGTVVGLVETKKPAPAENKPEPEQKRTCTKRNTSK